MNTRPLIDGTTKPRPVQLYECARCHTDIADEAVPIAVRIAAFVVPKATRDRQLEERQPDGSIGFDITDVGIPALIRELVDAAQHPDGHVYVGLGCFVELFQATPVNAAGNVVPIAPRAALDEKGIANTAYTGREHRDPVPVQGVARPVALPAETLEG